MGDSLTVARAVPAPSLCTTPDVPCTAAPAAWATRHVGDAQSQALDPQAGHIEEGLGRGGKGTEPVLPFGPDVFDLRLRLHRGQAAISLETHVLGGDVGHRQVGGVGEIERQLDRAGPRLDL